MERKTVGILLGDASGVGPEIVAEVAAKGFFDDKCLPIIIGDVRVFEKGLKIKDLECPHYIIDDSWEIDESKGLAVYDLNDQDPEKVIMGQVNKYCGEGDIHMLQAACKLTMDGKLSGFTYGPLHKGAMKEAGMKQESETEFMGDEFGHTGKIGEINMLGNLMTVRVTSHIPLKDVSAHLSVDNILSTIQLAYDTEVKSGNASPRIAVSGMNPHNGESGKCGTEEIEIITPAIEEAKAKGWDVSGPYPADIVFMRAFKGEFDAVVTMYHDQGQIALKVTGFDKGVTIGGGLPYPVTTAAHGTAFGRAGQGRASTTAFENAVNVLCKMVNNN